MRLPIVLTGVLLSIATPAHAVTGVLGREPDARACFERVYDAAHLARNPSQTVTRIRVSVSREPIPESTVTTPRDYLRIELTRRGDPEIRRAIGFSEHPFGGERVNSRGQVTNLGTPGARALLTGENHMDAEEGNDGGAVDIRPEPGGLFVRVSSPLRLRTGEKVSVDKGREFRLAASDRTFRLRALPASACEDLRRAIRDE
ncbi:MAG: hypothetical protein O9322_13170 [Beijerinckiaceae bacterium]|nr:hypothetical protein [Beijerinckiaceae bacterium]MCZ8300294.1 hypothetical protein [Beijerinckiaceae bacterium]